MRLLLLGLMLVGGIVKAAPAEYEIAPGVKLGAQIEIVDNHYEQTVYFQSQHIADLGQAVMGFRSAKLIEYFNRRVKRAEFKIEKGADANDYEFELTVGGTGFYFDHYYKCTEKMFANVYQRRCLQIPNKGRNLLSDSVLELTCTDLQADRGLNCVHHHYGTAMKFQIPLIKTISPFEVASYIYFYEVGYVAQMSLFLGHGGGDGKFIRNQFINDQQHAWFKEFERSIDQVVESYKKMPQEQKLRAQTFSGLEVLLANP